MLKYYNVQPGRAIPGVLNWRDLSADEVYLIAHLEHEARGLFADYLGRTAFDYESTQVAELAKNSQRVRRNFEQLTQSWLANLAIFRGLRVESGVEQPQNNPTGEALRRKRGEAGLTQKQLATAIGVTQATISRIENGRTTDLHPKNIARVRKYIRSGL